MKKLAILLIIALVFTSCSTCKSKQYRRSGKRYVEVQNIQHNFNTNNLCMSKYCFIFVV